MAKIEAPITPEVLVWVREVSRIPLNHVADKLKIDQSLLEAWENGAETPSFAQVQKLGELFKRPAAVFFLPEVPQEDLPPKDFRLLNPDSPSKLSPKSIVEIRRAMAKRESAIEIAESLGDDIHAFEDSASLSDDPELLGKRWRKHFEIEELRKKWTSEYDAFNSWRNAIESEDVFVFLASVPSLAEFRGIAHYDKFFPMIIVNSKDSPRGRIFSLLHEFAHLLLQVSGIGNMENPEDRTVRFNKIEVFCNAFAGSCLVPSDLFLADPLVTSINENPESVSLAVIRRLSTRFQASSEVILRRLLDLRAVNRATYNQTLVSLQEYYSRQAENKSAGFSDWTAQKASQNGEKFSKLVFRGAEAGVITSSDVSSMLGVKLNHLTKFAVKLKRKNS